MEGLEQIQTKTETTGEIILTHDQQDGLELLNKWAEDTAISGHALMARLIGSAGTGKTTLLRAFLDNNRRRRICVTAPTHKAKIQAQRITNRTSQTIQSLCGLRLNVNLDYYDPSKKTFQQQTPGTMKNYQIVILDEASMLGNRVDRDDEALKGLYDLVKSTAIENNVKILFVGDGCQLPPVKEAISKFVTDPDIVFEVILTEVIRQSNANPVTELLDIARQDIEELTNGTVDFLTSQPAKLNDDGGYIAYDDAQTFLKTMVDYFKSEKYADNKGYCKYIAWTNSSVSGANKYIRQAIMGTNIPNVVENDVLMAFDSIMTNLGKPDAKHTLINSEDYVVTSADELMENGFGVKGRVVVIQSLTLGTSSKLFIVDPSGYKKYTELHQDYRSKAEQGVSGGWSLFYKFKHANLLMENLTKLGQPAKGRDKVMEYKSLDYGYAITTHKSQGSTYNNVFVNMRDIALNKRKDEMRKLLYVALSRTSGRAEMLLPKGIEIPKARRKKKKK